MTGYVRPGNGAPPPGPLDWMDDAACAGSGELFFGPEYETDRARDDREMQAKRICAGCPARTPCLEYGESLPVPVLWFGVYGGLGEADRQALRRSRGQIQRREREEQDTNQEEEEAA